MRKRYYAIVVLLIGSHLLTELHTLIYWLDPQSQFNYVDNWFLKPGFRVDKLNVLWYFKMIEDLLLIAAILFAAASQSYSISYSRYLEWQRYSLRLYIIWCIYFAYHCFDLLSFFYNYKTSYWLYVSVLSLVTISSSVIAFYKSNKQ